MLTAARALMRSQKSGGREFPTVPQFADLYQLDWKPRYGEMTMIAARSGAGKSTFGLYYALATGLNTLYFSGDMSAFQASVKLACATQHEDIDTVVKLLDGERRDEVLAALPVSITFAFGEITRHGIDRHIDAYVELNNAYPDLIVVDNIMDMEGCEGDYDAQMKAMQWLHTLNRDTGSAVWVMAHMTDKGLKGRNSPHTPAPRDEIKNGLTEKPETILSLALNPFTNEMTCALVKNRLGKSDPSGNHFATVTAIPDQSRYLRKGAQDEPKRTTQADAGADQPPEPHSGGAVGVGQSEVAAKLQLRRGTPKALW